MGMVVGVVVVMNYNHLYYFHVAATEGTVAAAAARLGVGQPTVSEQIRALERTLRVSLFDRTPTGLRLTEPGRYAFEQTSVMFRAGERLIEALGHGPTDVPRTLRVGLSAAVARSITIDFLMPLLAIDDCMPTITTGAATDLIRQVRGHELDLALCESEPLAAARQGLEMAEIAPVVLIAVVQPQVTPNADWSDLKLIHYRPSSAHHADVDAYLHTHGYRPRLAAEADDALFMLEAAARGGYLAFVPGGLARDAVNAGRLRVLARMDAPNGGVYALHPDGVTADLARRAIDVMIDYVRSNPL